MPRVPLLRSFILALVLAGASGPAHAFPVDLNTFTADPAANVAISADGLTATFSEDAFASPISLSGHVSASDTLVNLSFHYELSVAPWNEDYFDFFVADISTPQLSVGGPADDVPLVFSGVHSVDLRPFGASSLPVIFDLGFGFGDLGLDSQLVISNVGAEVIPEPHAFLSMALGLAIVSTAARRRGLPGRRGSARVHGEASRDHEPQPILAAGLLPGPPAAPARRGL